MDKQNCTMKEYEETEKCDQTLNITQKETRLVLFLFKLINFMYYPPIPANYCSHKAVTCPPGWSCKLAHSYLIL